jgi:hypothetical protein
MKIYGNYFLVIKKTLGEALEAFEILTIESKTAIQLPEILPKSCFITTSFFSSEMSCIPF